MVATVAYFLGALMVANALGHFGASVSLRRLAPGVLSSPVLRRRAVAPGRDASSARLEGGLMPRMTASEQAEFLDAPGILMRIGTVRADGRPLVTPIWFLHEGGAIWFTPRENSEWLANLRRDPRVCLDIDEQALPYRKVIVDGRSRAGPRSGPGRSLARSLPPHRAPLWAGADGGGVHPGDDRSAACPAVRASRSRRGEELADAAVGRALREHVASPLLPAGDKLGRRF